MGKWKNRIVESGEESPENLLAHPENWRIHPKAQQDVMEEVLTTVGWVQDVIVNKRTGYLIDGHLRVQLALRHDEPLIPVKYIDVSEEEERLILATLDPIAAMAITDTTALSELADGLQSDSNALQKMVYETLGDTSGLLDTSEEILPDPEMQLQPERGYCVIICSDEEEWLTLQEKIGLELVKRGGYEKPSRFGGTDIQWSVPASTLLRLFNDS